MNKNQLIAFLEGLSLSDNEAKVYLAALSLGATSIQKIADNAEIKRTTAYSVVESLQQKGLIREEIKEFKRFFVAEHPESLKQIVENKKEQLDKLLPDFMSLYSDQGWQSIVRHYQGLSGVKQAYEQLLANLDPHEEYYLVLTNEKIWHEVDSEYFQNFRERRGKKLRMPMRMISVPSEASQKAKQFGKNYNAEVKNLPAGYSLQTTLIITPRQTLIHQMAPHQMALVIENQSIIQMHKEMFEIMWKSLV